MRLIMSLLLCLVPGLVAMHAHDATNVSNDMCFLTAVSSSRFGRAMAFLISIQKFHPCAKTYVYDLGLKKWEMRMLAALPYVMDVMDLTLPVRGKDYFPSNSCAFKPPMILQFIDKYRNNETDCRFFFYGDSVVHLHHKFNEKAFNEVQRLGIVAQAPRLNLAQLSFTHPGMFPYFGFDREWLFRNQYKPGGPGVMSQTQAGLMLVDAANTTMRETFFQEWADCAANDDCLIPDKVIIDKRPPHALAIFNISGHRVFRAHRDDQSAFTFLIAKYFGFGRHVTQKVYLDSYVKPLWVQYGTVPQLKASGENCTRLNSSYTAPNATAANSSSKKARHGTHSAGERREKPTSWRVQPPTTSRSLSEDLDLIQLQAVIDFVGAAILAVVVGILFRKWKQYWESDLQLPLP